MENFLATLLYGHHNVLEGMHEGEPIELGKDTQFDNGHSGILDPVQKIWEGAQFDALAKRDGVITDASWDEPLEKLELSPAFMERSAARLKKAYSIIDRIFAGHENECAEAKAIACQLLIDTRNDVAKILAA